MYYITFTAQLDMNAVVIIKPVLVLQVTLIFVTKEIIAALSKEYL
jgi:hypothetical protein